MKNLFARAQSLYLGKHRPFNDSELEYCRRVNGTKFFNYLNPGIRVESNYVDEKESDELLACANELKSKYGFNSSEAQDVIAVEDSVRDQDEIA